jgi:hypothetical protein
VLAIRKPAFAARSVPSGDQKSGATTALVPKVATMLCVAEYKRLGADGFKQKYGSAQVCMQQMAPKAVAIVKAALTQCVSAQNKMACVHAALARALGLPAPAAKK